MMKRTGQNIIFVQANNYILLSSLQISNKNLYIIETLILYSKEKMKICRPNKIIDIRVDAP